MFGAVAAVEVIVVVGIAISAYARRAVLFTDIVFALYDYPSVQIVLYFSTRTGILS